MASDAVSASVPGSFFHTVYPLETHLGHTCHCTHWLLDVFPYRLTVRGSTLFQHKQLLCGTDNIWEIGTTFGWTSEAM